MKDGILKKCSTNLQEGKKKNTENKQNTNNEIAALIYQ